MSTGMGQRELVRDGFGRRRALVVGDLMIDRYLVGDVGRISPEAPVPVVRLREETARVGGAGNVALNLSGLGLRTSIAGWTGDDAHRDRLLEVLTTSGVDTSAVDSIPGRPTTSKTRVLSRRQQLVRIDDEETGSLDADARAEFDARVVPLLDDEYDVVVLSDYAKGVLAPSLCQALLARAADRGIPVLVDPKGLDFAKYAGATAITPNESELVAAARLDSTDREGVLAAAGALRADLRVDVVAVTRGERGIVVVDGAGVHEVPARAREVFDVSGAGDTVVATLAASAAAQVPWVEAARLANVAAGITVAKTGTVPVTHDELLIALDTETGRVPAAASAKIVGLEDLGAIADGWRAAGDLVGFTNGCFDVLHAGHVASLDWARRHCDRLVVGVNSDASVSALKGPGRPVMPDHERATIVAALGVVDAVVVFADATPIRVISGLRPDVLVKGADYLEDEIVGAAEVRGWGGQVLRSPVIEGLSSTALLERARDTG